MLNVNDLIGKIVCADCMDILKQLPDKCVDLVLTDPPYGISYNNKKLKRKSSCEFRNIENDNSELDYCCLIKELERVAKTVIVFGANCFFTTGCFNHNCGRWICWDKRTTELADNALGFAFELAWTNKTSGYGKIYRVMHGGFINADGPNTQRIHPTQKPVILFEKILFDYSKENDLVLDCFSGSGTTAIACHRLNRRFICIEKDPEYAKASIKRLEDAKKQLTLF